MRVLIDTNVLFAAVLFDGVSRKAYKKAVEEPNSALVCDFTIAELKRTFNRKFPHMLGRLDTFLAEMMTAVTLVETPTKPVKQEALIRDENDRPIFRAAVKAKADAILTGDKDFLESGITTPKMLSYTDILK
jgi:putative PIN family toxin of toxin-antitoxin system